MKLNPPRFDVIADRQRISLRLSEDGSKILNDEEANNRLLVPYRLPWTHPRPNTV